MKIPEPVRKTIRCPLCHADFARKFIPSRKEKAEVAFFKAMGHMPATPEELDYVDLMAWAFMCHFCKIAIMCSDPCVGRWEEVYAKGEKILCPACDTEMRFFCTSTGFMLAQCPVKKCRARIETSAPDRKAGEVQLLDKDGEPLDLPSIDRPIATPEQPAVGQVGGSGADPTLPAVTTIVPTEGNA